eukprot:1316665-Pyramimonas_sp.AAC.1
MPQAALDHDRNHVCWHEYVTADTCGEYSCANMLAYKDADSPTRAAIWASIVDGPLLGALGLVVSQLQLLREDEVRAVAVGQVVLNLRPTTAVEGGYLEVPPASAPRCATWSRGCRGRRRRRL